jgi:hydrogenase nickel incorporation protein HypA/HybF
MHEVSIALSLIDLACSQSDLHLGERVDVLHLDVGALSGVDASALKFSFEVAAMDTPLEGARLEIRRSGGTELQLISLEVCR